MVAVLRSSHPDAVGISGEDRAEREAATVAAMQSGAPLVLGGRLPTDYRRPADRRARRAREGPGLARRTGPSTSKRHRTHEQGLSGIEATWSRP